MNVSDLIKVGENVEFASLPKPLKSLPSARVEQVAGALIRVRLVTDCGDLQGLPRSEVLLVWQGAGRQVRQPVVIERLKDKDIWLRVKEEQRREYMRVQARLGLAYRVIGADELEDVCERVLEHAEPAGVMGAEGDRLWGGEDVGELVNYHFSQMSRFLSQLDAKLDYLIAVSQGKAVSPPPMHDLETFDLSGGGLGFFETEPIEEGTYMDLRVQLSRLPFIEIHAVGQVIRNVEVRAPGGGKRFYVGVVFQCLHDDSREAIFRFISGIERKMLRERRDMLSS